MLTTATIKLKGGEELKVTSDACVISLALPEIQTAIISELDNVYVPWIEITVTITATPEN